MVHVNELAQFMGIIIDIFAIAALIYIVIVLKVVQFKFQKSDVLLQFERKRRDEIFQKSLFILAVSILFRFLIENGDAFDLFSESVFTVLYLISKLFLAFFIIMVMRTTSETKH